MRLIATWDKDARVDAAMVKTDPAGTGCH